MAIINQGSIEDFCVTVEEQSGPRVMALSDISEETTEVNTRFAVSEGRRGLTLETLAMSEGFPGFFDNLFDVSSEFYFLAWAWDMTGIHLYPGPVVDPRTCLIALTPSAHSRRFIGDGALLFPARQVSAGIALRVQVWESKQDLRKFGATMQKVGDVVASSELSGILALVAAGATGGASATISAVQQAAGKLAQHIGGVLAETADQLVDYYEGYFSATKAWNEESETHSGIGSEITIKKIT